MTQDAVDLFAAKNSGTEYNFLPAYLYALEQFQKKNNLPMYRLISYVKGLDYEHSKVETLLDVQANGSIKKTKAAKFVTPLARLNAHCLPGVQFKHSVKTRKMSVKIGDNAGLSEMNLTKLSRALGFYRNKITVDSDWFKAEFPPIEGEKREVDYQAKAHREAARMNLVQLDVYIAHLTNERKAKAVGGPVARPEDV